MPIYEFRCEICALFEQVHPMSRVPDLVDCPRCQAPARRVMSAPHLSASGSAAFGLIEQSARSASEPEVVRSTSPGLRSGAAVRVTANPLHHKLPRP